MPSILFIGAGRMAEAIFKGILQNEDSSFQPIYVANQSNQTKLQELSSIYKIQALSSWQEKLEVADVVLLAAPPSAHSRLLRELSSHVTNQLIVTVAAGIGPSELEQNLPSGTATAWIMPNTAAQASASISLYAFGSTVSDMQKELVRELVEAIGSGEEMSEEQVHELTAITGSAPAFVYEMTLQLEQLAKTHGLTDEQARNLVVSMLAGSAKMLQTGISPVELRNQVTTPGGATEAGLQSLERDQFSATISRAVIAVTEHARNKRN